MQQIIVHSSAIHAQHLSLFKCIAQSGNNTDASLPEDWKIKPGRRWIAWLMTFLDDQAPNSHTKAFSTVRTS